MYIYIHTHVFSSRGPEGSAFARAPLACLGFESSDPCSVIAVVAVAVAVVVAVVVAVAAVVAYKPCSALLLLLLGLGIMLFLV